MERDQCEGRKRERERETKKWTFEELVSDGYGEIRVGKRRRRRKKKPPFVLSLGVVVVVCVCACVCCAVRRNGGPAASDTQPPTLLGFFVVVCVSLSTSLDAVAVSIAIAMIIVTELLPVPLLSIFERQQ